MKAISRSRLIYLCGIVLLSGIVLGWWSQNLQSASGQLAQKMKQTLLPAPTFYLVADKAGCWSDEVEARGASNLPAGAIIDLRLADFHDDGWVDYSDVVNATVGKDGFFAAKIPVKQEASLPHNLIITATFGTVYHHQPQNVLKVVGSHGQNLDDLNNPQAYTVSGFNTILQTIARAACGPSHTE